MKEPRILDLSEVFPEITYDFRYLTINGAKFDTLVPIGSAPILVSGNPTDYEEDMAKDWCEEFTKLMLEAFK